MDENKIIIDKKRLSQYPSLMLEIDLQREKLARMKSSEQLPPSMKDSDGSKHTGGGSDRLGAAIARRLDQEPKILARIRRSEDACNAMEQAVDALENPLERSVLRLRYMEGVEDEETGVTVWGLKPWRDVCIEIYGSDTEKNMTATFRLHGSALLHLLDMQA